MTRRKPSARYIRTAIAIQARDPYQGDDLAKVTAVFVHGILGRPDTWADMLAVLRQDQELAEVTVEEFSYWSPWFNIAPTRVVPKLGAIASQLRTFLLHHVERDRRVVLVTHSMGGLVAQRYISDMLADGEGEQLRQIAAVVMYACPNSGSEFFLGVRKLLLWIPGLKHLQERHLRPHDREVMEARRRVVSHAVHATSVSSSSCPIAVFSYGGSEDGVVDDVIARDVFPGHGTVRGDHGSIVRPEGSRDTRYRVLRAALRDAHRPSDGAAESGRAFISHVVGEVPSAPAVHVDRQQAAQLSMLLQTATPNDYSRVVVLTGPPGVGKTQIAAVVARTAASSVPFVAWVRAEQTETLYADLARAADSLGIAQIGDSHRLAGRVVDYLSSTDERGLIVFDNASVEPAALRRLLPAVGGTRVLITSTDQSHASLGHRMEVEPFDHGDAVRYLTRAVPHLSESDAEDLAFRLDDYPLALEQASAYMRLHRLTVGQYVARLDSVPLARAIPQSAGSAYPRSVAAAIRLSFETSMEGASELCAISVGVLALVAQEALPWHLASADWPANPQQPHDAIFPEAFERSSSVSLVGTAETGHLRVHRLVARIILECLSARGYERDIVATALSWLKPKLFDNSGAWLRRHDGLDLVSRIEAVSSFALRALHAGHDELTAGVFSARSWAVRQLWKATDLESAQQLAVRIAAEASTVAGAESVIAQNANYDLAACYESAGRVDMAIQLFESVRAAREVPDGRVDATTVHIAHSLARAYRSAGRFSQALPLMQSVYEFLVRDRGSDDRLTLAAATDLAGLYESVGDVHRSIELFDQALRARVSALGPADPHTLSSMKHLAGALESAGRLDEAIVLYRQTLRQREQHLPADHPHTLISRSDLGYALESRDLIQGVNSMEALDILRASADDRTRVLGYTNPDALVARCDYGAALVRNGDVEAGTALLLATLVDSEHVLGRVHPNTVTVRHAVARSRRQAGDLAGALELFESVLADRSAWWPASNPDVCITRTDRAMTLAVLGQGDPAGDLEAVVEQADRRLGRDHPVTTVFAKAREIVTSPNMLADFRRCMPWAITEARWRAGRRTIKRPLD